MGIAELQEVDVILSWVRRFPWPAETQFRVLSVAERVQPSMLEVMGTTIHDVQQKADLHASAAASTVAAALRDLGFTAEPQTAEGDPKKELIEDAKGWGADLIVVGSDVNGGLRRALLGSVATAVTRNAPCSVLVIRITAEESRE